MKISEIKSDEVRNEAVRLAIRGSGVNYQNTAMNKRISSAFAWVKTPQNYDFWSDLNNGTTPNTPDLKLPNL